MTIASRSLQRALSIIGAAAAALSISVIAPSAAYAAANNCVLSTSLPSLQGGYVIGSGQYKCSNPVTRIDLHLEVFRNNQLLHSKDSSASQRPGYKLYSLTSILGPACQPGTYHWDVTGWVTYAGGSGSGRATSTPVYFGC